MPGSIPAASSIRPDWQTEEAFRILDKAYEPGINFYDTAEVYPVPPTAELAVLTERIFGEWIQTRPRDSLIIATKVAGAASGWFVPPIRHGLTAIDRKVSGVCTAAKPPSMQQSPGTPILNSSHSAVQSGMEGDGVLRLVRELAALFTPFTEYES